MPVTRISTVMRETSNSSMPAFAAVLGDAEIADIINFERSSWGNHGKPVTAAQVAAERARP